MLAPPKHDRTKHVPWVGPAPMRSKRKAGSVHSGGETLRQRAQAAGHAHKQRAQAAGHTHRQRAQAADHIARLGCWLFTEVARIGCRPTRPRPRAQHVGPAYKQRTTCRTSAQQAGHTPRPSTACRPHAQQAGHTPRPRAQHAGHAHRQCTHHAGSRPRVHGPTAGHGIAWGLLGRWWAENPDGLLGLRTWGAETHGGPSPCPKHQTT